MEQRSHVVALLEQVWAQDPLYAPRAELDLELGPVLGQGGIGVVHRVRDRRLGREAALKLLLLETPDRRLRFDREARLTARLDHPAVPAVYAYGTTCAGQRFLLLRYVRGESLARLLAARASGSPGGPQLRELLAALVKVAEAVAYAHSRGVVHRDLKPDNVLLGRFGEVVVLDWGLARDLGERADAEPVPLPGASAPGGAGRLTQDGAFLGTPGYMAPEQARGGEVGPAADVFALGVILTEVLTGEPVWGKGSAMDLIRRAVEESPRTPRQISPGVPRELEAIAARALAPDPAARYPSALEFARDLTAALEGRPVSALRYGPLARLQQAVARAPLRAAVLAVALVLTISAWALVQRAGLEGPALVRRRLAESARAELAAAPLEPALGSSLRRLGVALRWQSLQPDDAAARQASVAAAWALGEAAAARSQWTLAAAALGDLAGGGAEAEAGRARLQELRAQADAQRRGEVDGLLAAACAPGLTADDAADLGLRLLGAMDAVGQARVIERLDAVSATMEQVAERCWTGVDPSPEAIAAREAYFSRTPGDDAPEELLLGGVARALLATEGVAGERLEEPVGPALALIGQRQREALGPQALDVARVCCEALGRSRAPGAVSALSRYLRAEGDQERAVTAGLALLRSGAPEGLLQVRYAQRRFGVNGRFSQRVNPRLVKLHEGGEAPPASSDFEEGALLLDKGDPAGAREVFARLVQSEPGNPNAWASLALACDQLGEGELALEHYARALSILPTSQAVLLNRARCFAHLGRFEEALADCETDLQLRPGGLLGLTSRAEIRREAGDLTGALDDFALAAEADPQAFGPWLERGNLLMRLGRGVEAEQAFDRALELGPEVAQTWASRAQVRLQRGDRRGAEADAERALELDDGCAFALGTRAVIRAERGLLEEACADLARAESLEPRQFSYPCNLGHMLRGKGDLAGARAAYRRSQAIAPREFLPTVCLAVLDLEQGDPEGAELEASRAVALDPPSPLPWLLRGQARLLLHRVDEALEDLNEAERRAEGGALDTAYQLFRGVCFALQGRRAEALREWVACEEQQPIAAVWLVGLGGTPARLDQLAARPDWVGALARYARGALTEPQLMEQVSRERHQADAEAFLGLLAERDQDLAAARARYRRAVEQPDRGSTLRAWAVLRLRALEGGQ